MAGQATRHLTFRAAGRLQTLPTDAVREVLKLPALTRVPRARAGLLGLVNVRGAATLVLSVAALQGEGASSACGDRLIVLDRTDAIGLLVDEVREISEGEARPQGLDIEALVGLAFGQAQAQARVALATRRPVAAPEKAVERSTLDLIAFDVCGHEFALPLEHVAEVILRPAGIVGMPDADAAVVGTIEHRGTLLPILALAPLLGLPADKQMEASRIVITVVREHRVGLAVEMVKSVIRVDEDNVDPVPTVIARRKSETRIRAVARLDDGQRLISVLSAEKLFNDALMAHVSERRGAQQEAQIAEASEPFVVFRLGTQSFGLPAMAVEEIVRLPAALTHLPRAPAFVEGIMNLRGQAIPVINQRLRFGEVASSDTRRGALVVSIASLRAAFAVDEVTEIRRVPTASIGLAPGISDETRLFDRTAMMADGQIVLLIDPTELLDGAERDLLTALHTDPVSPSP